jgi:hypothetical protein
MIKIKTYSIENLFLTKEVVSVFINKFWKDEYPIKNQKHIMLMVKVQFTESEMGYRTLGHLRRVNFSDKDLFIDYIVERLTVLHDSYTSLSINKIVFSYIIQDGIASDTRTLLLNLDDKELTTHRFNNMNLPITMDPYSYGIVRSREVMETFIRYIIKASNNKVYEIDVSLDEKVNNVSLLGASDLKWTDTIVNDDIFKREIQKSTIFFLDGEIILRKQELPAKPFNKLNVEKSLQKNFVTLDLETIKQNNQLVPYLICAYNGKDYITAYADSLLDQKTLFKTFFIKLLTFFKKSGKLIVYAHNLSSFDGIFLLKHLIHYGEVKPLFFNGRIMSIRLTLNIEGYQGKVILFKDSYLMLAYSLRKLCESFGVKTMKSYFPYLLTNIFYSGILPKFDFWKDVSPQTYEMLKKQFKYRVWNFQIEAIKYCKLDCLALHEILTTFNQIFFDKFKINIHSSLTAPSLAMRLFKTEFMPDNSIFSIHGDVEKAIRESYSGGAVDVYIPHSKIGSFFSKVWRTLYYYDVNSLYPTVMAKLPMPIGKPIFFEGDIRKIDPQAFGFFFCKIISPNNIQHPLLQRRVQTSEGVRTVAGLGTWNGWICSSEMDNAMKYGYTFEILKGYEFKTGDIFSNFVNTMYELRQEYPKGDPMNLTAKLMMNSLYGKFGMRNEFNRVDIFPIITEADKIKFKKMLDVWGTTVKDFILLEDQLIVVRDSKLDLITNPEDDSYHGAETNIAIASAITAHGRVHMSFFKNNPNFHLYYSDTDSAFIDVALPKELIGEALGLVKLEHVIKKAVFLAPKVYALITEDGKEIIKVKGITQKAILAENLNFNDIEALLALHSYRTFSQEKWYKSIIKGTINVSDIAYTLLIKSIYTLFKITVIMFIILKFI